MKVEHLLVVFGTVVGGLSAALAFYLLSVSGVLPGELPEGAQFENLADLRQSLTVRDERDQQPGGGVSLRSILRPHHSDLIIFELIPDLNVEFQGVPVRTNSHGMRGPEISLTKPADTYRIALLGDSFAFGWGVEEQQTFARVMERELNRMTKGSPKVELLNFGVPGYSAFQEVATLEEKALAFSPDAVLLYVVENDFGLPFFIRDLSDGESLVPGKEFHIDAAKKDDQEIQARRRKLINDMDGNRAILRLADFCEAKGVKLFAAINPNANTDKTKKLMWALPEVRKSGKLTFLELREEFLQMLQSKIVPEESLRLKGDPHPGPGGHQLVGTLLAKKFSQHVPLALK